MKPIRGPIDYNRYPPRDRRNATNAAATNAAADSPQSAQNLPASHHPSATPNRATPRSRAQNARGARPDASLNQGAAADAARDASKRPGDASQHLASDAARRHSPSGARRDAGQAGVGLDQRPWSQEDTGGDFQIQDEEAMAQTPGEESAGEEWPGAIPDTRRGRRMRSRRDRVWRAQHANAQHANAQHANAQGVDGQRGTRGRGAAGGRRVRSGRRRVALWKRARRWAFLLLLALFGELGVAALTSSHFAIARVEVQGLNITPASSVTQVQDALLGQNWLRARVGQAKTELEKVPSIRSVELTRMLAWPPQILVRVSERQAFARVGADRNWFIVDREGVPFREATREDDALYAVTGPTLQPRLGRALPPSAWLRVRQVAQALAQSEKDGERWALRRLYFDRDGFASLRLTGGSQDETLVQLGADRWPEKLRRARQALAYFEATGRRVSTLNLLSYSMPIWTPKPTPQASPTATPTSQNIRNGTESEAATLPPGTAAARVPTTS